MGERKLLFYRKTRMPTPLGRTDGRTDGQTWPPYNSQIEPYTDEHQRPSRRVSAATETGLNFKN